MTEDGAAQQSVGESPVDPPGYIHHSAAVSDRGGRHDNQDSLLLEDELGLYAVADGVGGHQAGDVASAMAVQVLRDVVSHWRHDENPPREKPYTVLHRAIESACATIHRSAKEDPKRAGMSTTLTAMLVDGDEAVMAHVGDSRLYLLREGKLDQISTDHTLAAELYRGGVIPREHIERHPHAHVLTRNVGTQPSVKIETLLLEIHPGDLVLLSSDGLNPGMHPPEHVVDLLDATTDLAGALGQLVERAKQAGSHDNITAIAWRRDGSAGSLTRPVVETLRSVPLFSRLIMADLVRVASELTALTYEAGEVLVRQGEPNAALYVVHKGRLRWELPDGQYAYLERGSDIGTTTLVAARKSPGTLLAEERCRVLVLGCEAFRNLCKLRPRLGVHLLTELADELSEWIYPETDRGVARPPNGLLVEY